MKPLVNLAMVLAAAFTQVSAQPQPAAKHAAESFMPANDLWKQDGRLYGGLNKKQFDRVLDRVESIYKPLVQKNFGAELTIVRDFNDPTVNAFADQIDDTHWEVHMFGGLARRPEVSEDGFAMVACHEIGHHLGGFPFFAGQPLAVEGQADMHATGPCASLVFAPNAELSRRALETIPPEQKAECDAAHPALADRDICYRAVVAGKSLADLLGALEGSKVAFDTPDQSQVTVTDENHPRAQCRLDTYVASALCGNQFWNYSVIPGKAFSDRGSAAAQDDAFQHSCVSGAGARPRCWFAPLGGG